MAETALIDRHAKKGINQMTSYNTLLDLFTAGGIAMYPLLLCSVLSLSAVIERTIYWMTEGRAVSVSRLAALVSKDASPKGEAAASPTETRALELIQHGLTEEAAAVIEAESVTTFTRATNFLPLLDCVIAVAPLLGILGTVLGIIQAFQKLNFANGAIPTDVGQGLAEALITTAAGLIIAIPTMVAHSFLTSLARKKAIAIASVAENIRLKTPGSMQQVAA
jgi:biopolymer transport protein ExbB